MKTTLMIGLLATASAVWAPGQLTQIKPSANASQCSMCEQKDRQAARRRNLDRTKERMNRTYERLGRLGRLFR